MGLFDSKSLLEKKVESIVNSTDYVYGEQLKDFDFSLYLQKFNSEKLLCDVLSSIVRKNLGFQEKLAYIIPMYESMCLNPESVEEEYTFKKLVEVYLDIPLYFENNNFMKVVQSFNDKKLVLEFFSFLKTTQWDRYKLQDSENIGSSYYKNLSILINYLPSARQYFTDDRALFSSAIDLFNATNFSMINSNNGGRCVNLVNEKLSQAMKANGVYDIDQDVLAEVDAKINASEGLQKKLTELISATERKVKSLEEALTFTQDQIVRTRIEEVKKVQEEATKILKQINEDYTKILTEQRSSLVAEKDEILSAVAQEIERYKIGLRSEASVLTQKVAIELKRIHTASSDSIENFKKFISNNDDIQRIIKDTQNGNDFVTYLAQMEKIMGPIGAQPIILPEGSVNATPANVVVPNIIIPSEERQVDRTINYYFDRNIPYKERFAKLMELKQKDIEETGAIYHEKFDDVLAIIMQNDTPYMYGPSGCGKTYMITNQLAKLLNMDVVTNGYVLYEQDVLGYTNSGTGSYVPSNFYRCYKFGDMIFFDELDNGVANATVVLNHFLGGTENDFYTFPDGARLQRHPNFRIIAAGNTNGMGRTLEHNTRQKMDESVMQRLTPIEIKYDNRIEKGILKDYPDWYNFMINFRKAIESCSNGSHNEVNNIGTFTTRDADSVKRYKDDDCFTDQQLMEYEILENKDVDYLKGIEKKLLDLDTAGEFNAGGKKLLKLYSKCCEMRKAK